MGGGSGKLAGREGAASPISWWPVARAKVSIVFVVVVYSSQMRRSMLCSYAARWWCDRGVPVPGRGQGLLRDESVQQQWSWSGRPVDSGMATRLLLLFTNLATCRQSVDWICRRRGAFAIKRNDLGQSTLEGGFLCPR